MSNKIQHHCGMSVPESGFKHGFKAPKRNVWKSRKLTSKQAEAEQERAYRRCLLRRLRVERDLSVITAYQAASAIQEVSQACGVEISHAEALSVVEQAKETLPRAIAALRAAGLQVTSYLLADLLCGALADYLERRRQ